MVAVAVAERLLLAVLDMVMDGVTELLAVTEIDCDTLAVRDTEAAALTEELKL